MIKIYNTRFTTYYHSNDPLPKETHELLKKLGLIPLDNPQGYVLSVIITKEHISQAQAVMEYMDKMHFEYTSDVRRAVLGSVMHGNAYFVPKDRFDHFWNFALFSQLIELCDKNKIPMTPEHFKKVLLLTGDKTSTSLLLNIMAEHQIEFTLERFQKLTLHSELTHTSRLNRILKILSEHDKSYKTHLTSTLFDRALTDTSQGLHSYISNPFILMFDGGRHAHLLTLKNIQAILQYEKNTPLGSSAQHFFQHVVLDQTQFNLMIRYGLMAKIAELRQGHNNPYRDSPLSELEDQALRTEVIKITAPELSKILDKILNSFEEKIKHIGLHHSQAKARAQTLLNTLRSDKNELFKDPNFQTLTAFKNKVHTDIMEAIPSLQKDLSWKDYLSNLLSQLVNTVTSFLAQVFSLGQSKHQGFFSLRQAESVIEAENLRKEIDSKILEDDNVNTPTPS